MISHATILSFVTLTVDKAKREYTLKNQRKIGKNFWMKRSFQSEWGVSTTESGEHWLSNEFNHESPLKDTQTDKILNSLLDIDFRAIPQLSFDGIQIPEASDQVMIVQLLKISDISKPLGPEDETEADEGLEEIYARKGPKKFFGGKRLLRLNLTSLSGEMKFEALEMTRIDCLSENLIPGTKLILKGPLEMCAGFALLDSKERVKVLGGGVKRLSDGWKLNRDVKAARKGDLTGEQQPSHSSNGPPRFISFLDSVKVKQPKKAQETQAPQQIKEQQQTADEDTKNRMVDAVNVSDKLKDLRSAKVTSDSFAIKGKGNFRRAPHDRRQSRRENDALVDMYRPPVHQAPTLSAFFRLDKCSNLHDAQILSDAMMHDGVESREVQKSDNGGKGSFRSREMHVRRKGIGKGRGKDRR